MSDHWNFYFATVDNEPASIFVDLGIASELPCAKFPNIGHLRLQMKNPREDGLSSSNDFDELSALEDHLTKAMTEKRGWFSRGAAAKSVFVGRNTSAGHRDFYFYTNNAGFEADLRKLMQKWPGYAFQTGMRPDPDWTVYREFLYPGPEDFQRMGNRDLLEQLRQNGDRSEIARMIDHFAYFPNEADRSRFATYLTGHGFEIENQETRQPAQFSVSFRRMDKPIDMDDVTIELLRAAGKANGDYDGWGCPIAD